MARGTKIRTGATLLLLFAITLVVAADKCKSGCGGVSANTFKYQEGTTYKYNFDGNVDIALSSAEAQQTSIKVRATVLLTQLPECNQLIRLQNVQIIGPGTKKYSQLADVEKAIRINFHDGLVEPEICAEPGDTQNSLNIKRAVASMFQAALKHDHEHDVFGDCPTDISTSKEGGNIFIHKRRNLNRCGHRQNIKQDFMATAINPNSAIKSSPLLNADYESEQRVKNGILEYALVTENYLYKAFSDGKNGAKATVSTKITLAGQSKEAVQPKTTEPKSIHFDDPHMDTVKTSNIDNILDAMRKTKETMDVSVTEKSAKTFVQLIKVLRASRKEDILAVFGQIRTGAGFTDKESARKVYFDALFRTGTGDAAEAIVDLYKSKQLSPVEQKLMLLSLAFVRHATPGSINAAAMLLDQPGIPREAYLAVGLLAGKYCKEHHCGIDEINRLVAKLATKLNPRPANRDEENNMIACMKGLSNIHHHLDDDVVIGKLIAIAKSKEAPSRLRVAALDVFASDACEPKLRDAALNILKDRQEDSEIRIKAYLAVAQCPDSKSANAIGDMLNTEPSHQVGSFIVTHLRNLRSSANPDRELAKRHLGVIRTTKRFPFDIRKYSFNNEFSYSVDTLGAASAVEANVIYSQDSFLPRSTSLNLTTELFGHTFNFLEIGTRQENLDRVVEHYFGPLGLFSTSSPQDLFETSKDSITKLMEHIRDRYQKTARGKRDVSKAELDALSKQIKVKQHALDKDLDLDLSVKVLGSEVLFLSLNEDIQKLSPEAIVDKMFDCMDKGIDKAKKFEYHLKNHMLLLDTELSYPTALGFPLRLTVEGAAAVHFMSHGSVDIRQIIKDPQNAHVEFSVIPSANFEFSATMSIDTHLVETGLKVSSSVLSSTGVDVDFRLLQNGKGVDMKVGVPVEKQTLVSFSHDIVFATSVLGQAEHATALKFKDKQKEVSMCFDQLSPFVGLAFCGSLATPSTLATNHVTFPLNGPSHLSVYIEREDLKEYHFKALLNDAKPHSKSVEITFETPGSKMDRSVNLALEATAEPEKKLVRATLKSPLKTAVLEGVIADSAKEKSAMLRFQYDTQEYYGKVGVVIDGNAAKQTFKPLIEYNVPGDVVKTKGNRKPDYTVEGQVVVEKEGDKRKFTFEKVKLVAVGQPEIGIDGFLARDGSNKFSADLKVHRDNAGMHLIGDVLAEPKHVAFDVQVQNTINTNANFHVKYELKRGDHEYDTSLIVVHGPDLKSTKHVFTFGQMIKCHSGNAQNLDFETKNKLTYPLVGISAKLNGKANKKQVGYDFELGYGKFKVESELDAKLNRKVPGDYDVKFDVEVMKNKVEFTAKRDIAGDKSTVSNALDVSGKKYSVEGTVTHHVKPNDVNVGTDLVFKLAGSNDPIKVKTGLVSNSQQLDSHAKVSTGAVVYVDINAKASRGPNPNGHLKVFVLNMIKANGAFEATGGKGTGNIVVDVPKADRKLKAETVFNLARPTYDASVNVYLDFEKDNTQKLHFDTKNKIEQDSLETRNVIEVLQHKLEVNGKVHRQGEFGNGKLTSEFDVTLPNGHYLAGRMDRELHTVNGVLNGNGHVTLEHRPKKSAPGRKLDIKSTAKDVDRSKKVFDVHHQLVAEDIDGKNFKLDLHGKTALRDGRRHSSLTTKMHGSLLPQAFEFSIDGDYTKKEGNYKLGGRYGKDTSATVQGKYDVTGGATPYSGNVDVQITLPTDKHKGPIKFSAAGKAHHDKEHHKHEASGTLSISLNDDQHFESEAHVEASKHHGKFKITARLPSEEPISVAGSYGHEETTPGFGKCHCELEVVYAKDKTVKTAMTLDRHNENEVDLELKAVTPSEFAKVINVQLKNKRDPTGKRFNNELVLTADQKSYSLTSELVISETHPSIEVKMTNPDGKKSRIFATFNKLSAKHVTAEVHVESIKDFSLDLTGEAKFNSIDDLHITVNAHSDKLHLNKVKLEAASKPAKGKKLIEFSATSDGKNILSGSTSYEAREQEEGKFIVEGSGSLKYKEETKSANFKYMRQTLVQEKDGEQGIDIMLNAGLGSQGLVGELKLTNKQFRILNSYCEEKKQCAHVEVFSKVSSTADAEEFSHELEVNVDLRKLGFSHEFGLKAVTAKKGLTLDHTVDMHFQSAGDSKYQYSLYVHPHEAGVVFTTPKRVIALEGKADLPAKNKHSPIKAELALYMNKKTEPAKKTVLSYVCDHEFSENAGRATTELKFSNPSLSKELLIKYSSKYDVPSRHAEFSVDLDIFGKKNQRLSIVGKVNAEKLEKGYKVVSEAKIVSKGLDIEVNLKERLSLQPQDVDYGFLMSYRLDKTQQADNEFRFSANLKKLEVLLKLLNKDLVHVNSALQLSRDAQIADAEVTLLGLAPHVNHIEIKDYNTFKYTAYKKESPANKLQVSTGFVPGQIADFRAEVLKGSAKNDLIHASIRLDDGNFLKPDFGVSAENVQKLLLEPMQKQMVAAVEELKKVAQDYRKTVTAHAKQLADAAGKAAPNLKPMVEYYKQEFTKLRDELLSDKTVKEISEFLKKVLGATVQTASEIFGKVSSLLEKFVGIVREHSSKITTAIAEDLLPAINDFGAKLIDFCTSVFRSLYDVAVVYIGKAAEFLRAHQDELKQLATAFTESFQEFGRLAMKTYTLVREELQKFVREVYEQVKALPIFESLKEQYEMMVQGMPVPEYVLNVINEVCSTAKDAMPTPEMAQFIAKLQEYVAKKLKKEQVDDIEALKHLQQALVKAIASLLKFIEAHHGSPADLRGALESSIPFPTTGALQLIPKLATVKFSPFSYLVNGDFPSVKDLLHHLTLNPVNMLPPGSFLGQIVLGGHVFTFDGRHLTIPGQCSYLLAKDAANGNFSIAATFGEGGRMDSITFGDKKDTVTVRKGGVSVLNGRPTELPVRPKGFHVYRYEGHFEIYAFSGVHIYCDINLLACSAIVSGFYHGETRGLFGNANHEPYDDLTLPNGKVAAHEADFSNAYKLGGCKAGAGLPAHDAQHHAEGCDALFGQSSPMRMCFPFVDPENFHQACEQGVAAKVPETEHALALSYVGACMHENVLIGVPSRFLRCENGDVSREIGEQFSVKLPGKAADILFIIDQDKDNEATYTGLVQPLTAKLTAELAAKGVSDVQYAVIGYGGEYHKHPSAYTSGGKLSFQGKPMDLKFAEEPKRKPFNTGCEHADTALETLHTVLHTVQHNLGMTSEGDAIRRAFDHPFRAHAIKSIVLVRPQYTGPGKTLSYLRFLATFSFFRDVHLTYVTPVEHLRLGSAAKDGKGAKNVVGFNKHAVYTFKKADGSADMLKDLDYTDDSRISNVIRHDGNVIASNNLQGKQKKQFIDVAAHMVTAQLTKATTGVDCVCARHNFFSARNVCHTTQSDGATPGINLLQDLRYAAQKLATEVIAFAPK